MSRPPSPLFGLFAGPSPPPDSIPLRLLGLDVMPSERSAIVAAFRRSVRAAHPDIRIDDMGEAEDTTVPELVWAREFLIAKLPPPVTRAKPVTTRSPVEGTAGSSRNSNGRTWEQVEALRDVAALDFRVCPRCGKDQTPDAPVWRRTDSHNRLWLICGECAPRMVDTAKYLLPMPCEMCGRPVHDYRSRDVVTCSQVCASGLKKRIAAEKRAESRGERYCERCHNRIAAERGDARYCSNACRQATYRQRKAEA